MQIDLQRVRSFNEQAYLDEINKIDQYERCMSCLKHISPAD